MKENLKKNKEQQPDLDFFDFIDQVNLIINYYNEKYLDSYNNFISKSEINDLQDFTKSYLVTKFNISKDFNLN